MTRHPAHTGSVPVGGVEQIGGSVPPVVVSDDPATSPAVAGPVRRAEFITVRRTTLIKTAVVLVGLSGFVGWAVSDAWAREAEADAREKSCWFKAPLVEVKCR